MLEFYNRIYKLATLAALNFQPHEKATWVEQKTREIFYKGLDNSLKLEIDSIESKDGTHMSSSQLLETYICRQNLKASPLNLDDTLLNVARVKEYKPQPPRRKRINMVTSYGEVNMSKEDTSPSPSNSGNSHNTQTPTTDRKFQNRERTPNSREHSVARPLTDRSTGTLPKPPFKSHQSPTRTPEPMQRASRTTPFRDTARQRLARPPSPSGRERDRRTNSRPRVPQPFNQNPGQTQPQAQPQSTRKHLKDSTIELMKKLHLTRDTIDRVGIHCFRCGAGRPDISQHPFHTMNGCPLPNWAGEPHHCTDKVKLLHHPAQCPLKSKRVSRIRIED